MKPLFQRVITGIRIGLAFLFCLVLVPVACTQDMRWSAVERMIESDYPGIPRITTDSLARRLDDSTSAPPVLLDARTADEYAVSHLPGALRVDPSAPVYPELDSLSSDRPIVVYCSVGYRSARVMRGALVLAIVRVLSLLGPS